nr:hypothetical protein Iba_chr07cCG7920 [Ipomoea batatas]GMD92464.1 hypothetical protein Iba_scaffold54186CG0010 [Ipomoea batatas]
MHVTSQPVTKSVSINANDPGLPVVDHDACVTSKLIVEEQITTDFIGLRFFEHRAIVSTKLAGAVSAEYLTSAWKKPPGSSLKACMTWANNASMRMIKTLAAPAIPLRYPLHSELRDFSQASVKFYMGRRPKRHLIENIIFRSPGTKAEKALDRKDHIPVTKPKAEKALDRKGHIPVTRPKAEKALDLQDHSSRRLRKH